MIGKYEEYPETLNRLFIEDKTRGFDAKTNGIYARTITFQVTEDCCMKCTYCYQHNKKPNVMSFEIAKQFIDDLLSGSDKLTNYIPKETVGIGEKESGTSIRISKIPDQPPLLHEHAQ